MFKTNEYFDGKVKSITFQSETLPATIGVMAAGVYTFNTADKEKMTIISGSLSVMLPGSSSHHTFAAGESFDVAADSSFEVTADGETAYLCLYG